MSEQNEKIAACPFCGSAADIQSDFGRVFWAQCKNLDCGSTDGIEWKTPREAAAHWNRRAQPAPTVQAPNDSWIVVSRKGVEWLMQYKPESCAKAMLCDARGKLFEPAAPAHASSDGRDAREFKQWFDDAIMSYFSHDSDREGETVMWASTDDIWLFAVAARAALAGTGVKGGGNA